MMVNLTKLRDKLEFPHTCLSLWTGKNSFSDGESRDKRKGQKVVQLKMAMHGQLFLRLFYMQH